MAENCVIVGTHRHGCCVLQRCIDHASGHQKAELIAAITNNAHELVQNPFGNYVLQYIIDLQEKEFTDPLCYTFAGFVCGYSKQKFSSNVIEKCIRGADSQVSRVLIEEMLTPTELEKLLRDNYANYVVQTAIEYADTDLKKTLVEHIEPLLPSIRQTPIIVAFRTRSTLRRARAATAVMLLHMTLPALVRLLLVRKVRWLLPAVSIHLPITTST